MEPKKVAFQLVSSGFSPRHLIRTDQVLFNFCLQYRTQRRRRFYPWVRKIPWRRKSQNPLQYSCPKNPMDRGTWRATVQRVATSWTRLSIKHAHKMCKRHEISYAKNSSWEKTNVAFWYLDILS